MTLTSTAPARAREPSLRYAYLMIGTGIGCMCLSGVLGSIFSPDLISTSGTAFGGYAHQHVPLAAYSGWIWPLIAIAMFLPAAMRGIRAKVTDRAAWTILGIGAGGIWLAVMFVSIFTPELVTGTAPWLTWVPLASFFSVIVGIILTGLLCRFVRTAFFEPAATVEPPAETTPVAVSPMSEVDGAANKLRQLAQLRDSGVITEAEFQKKKDELLNRI